MKGRSIAFADADLIGDVGDYHGMPNRWLARHPTFRTVHFHQRCDPRGLLRHHHWAMMCEAQPDVVWLGLPAVFGNFLNANGTARVYAPAWLDELFDVISMAHGFASYELLAPVIGRACAAVGGASNLRAVFALGGWRAVTDLTVPHEGP